MTESAFISANINRWQEFEASLKSPKGESPDHLKSLFLQTTDDLAYAQTFFKGGEAENYLQQLSHKLQSTVTKRRAFHWAKFSRFWSQELPLISYKYRRTLLYSVLIFLLSVGIGVFSAAKDPTYTRLIMGDRYVDMTESFIEDEDPMAVYKQAGQTEMFLGITFNNIMVSFYAFALGLFTAVGTVYIMVSNGIMLGAFQFFFFQKGLFWTSFLTIWIHGTLEISAIVIAGAAGMILGNSFMFPKSYSRVESFNRGARDGMKLVIGLVPIFITAGFLEGFVTRLTDMPTALKVFIIVASMGFILFYFSWYPRLIYQSYKHQQKHVS